MAARLMAHEPKMTHFHVGYELRPSHQRDLCVYVDLLGGKTDLINQVVFDFDETTRICCSNSQKVWKSPDAAAPVVRFAALVRRRSAQDPCRAVFQIKLLGRDGSKVTLDPYPLLVGPQFGQIYEARKNTGSIQRSKPACLNTLPPKRTFGVELELSDDYGSSRDQIARSIAGRSGESVIVVREYRQAHNPGDGWKLVHDGSIACRRVAPDCSKFELVSPILRGENGVASCYKVLEALQVSSSTHISVNRSMGFHVHVSVENMRLDQLKKVCQNFVKFEDAMDSFMPPSRRTGSSDSNSFCQSCKEAIRNPGGSVAKLNGGRHRAIDGCTTKKQLCHLMNPSGRYYKLNLQNLVTGRQPTVEFRQHSATASPDKVSAWVRFCVAFVHHSASPKAATDYLKNTAGADEQFEVLFDQLIQDPVLKRFFRKRRDKLTEADVAAQLSAMRLGSSAHRSPCCSGCAHGGRCASTHW